MKQGKKIGVVTIPLKKAVRGSEAVTLDLRCDTRAGTFHVEYEGEWYQDRSLEELKRRLADIVAATEDIEWTRYIVVDYKAETCERNSFGENWSHNYVGPDWDRKKLEGVEYEDWAKQKKNRPSLHESARFDEEPMFIVGLSLEWQIEDYSAPFRRPGVAREQMVRLKRGVDLRTLEPGSVVTQTRDDELPPGAMLFSPQRLKQLELLRDALTSVDAKLAAMFAGDVNKVGFQVDASRAFEHNEPALLLSRTPDGCVAPDTTKPPGLLGEVILHPTGGGDR